MTDVLETPLTSELSPSAQDHLKAIYALQEFSDQPVTISAVGRKTGLKLSTTSGAITKLVDSKLVTRAKDNSLNLTEAGLAVALVMIRRHRLIESFLVSTLGYSSDQVHQEAEALEHVVSDFLIERVDQLLGHPEFGPHGEPIPSPTGQVHELDAVALSQVETPTKVRVARISDSDPALLRYLSENSIEVGTEVSVTDGPEFSQSLLLKPTDSPDVVLGLAASGSIWVEVLG